MHILDYAPRPRLWRKRFRRTVLAVLVLFLAAAGVCWYPDINFRIRLAYWQHQCMNHVISADKVILTADPKLVPSLLQDPEYVQITADFASGPLAAYSPRCFREYQRMAVPANTLGIAVIFMHRLKSPQGIERLVIAFDRGAASTRSLPEDSIEAVVIEPRRLFGDLNPLGGLRRAFSDTSTFRFHPGLVDPTDPAHFTVRWQNMFPDPGDQRPTHGIFDFRLSSDGATVTRTDLAADPLSQSINPLTLA